MTELAWSVADATIGNGKGIIYGSEQVRKLKLLSGWQEVDPAPTANAVSRRI